MEAMYVMYLKVLAYDVKLCLIYSVVSVLVLLWHQLISSVKRTLKLRSRRREREARATNCVQLRVNERGAYL